MLIKNQKFKISSNISVNSKFLFYKKLLEVKKNAHCDCVALFCFQVDQGCNCFEIKLIFHLTKFNWFGDSFEFYVFFSEILSSETSALSSSF